MRSHCRHHGGGGRRRKDAFAGTKFIHGPAHSQAPVHVVHRPRRCAYTRGVSELDVVWCGVTVRALYCVCAATCPRGTNIASQAKILMPISEANPLIAPRSTPLCACMQAGAREVHLLASQHRPVSGCTQSIHRCDATAARNWLSGGHAANVRRPRGLLFSHLSACSFQRWMVFLPVLICQLCIGSLYSWSIFNSSMDKVSSMRLTICARDQGDS